MPRNQMKELFWQSEDKLGKIYIITFDMLFFSQDWSTSAGRYFFSNSIIIFCVGGGGSIWKSVLLKIGCKNGSIRREVERSELFYNDPGFVKKI